MTKLKIADTVAKDPETGLWAFTCPSPTGCGDAAHDTSSRFTSTMWPTKELAIARGQQHINEHVTGEPAPTLDEFRAAHNLTPTADGSVVVDLTQYLED
jgi:hypothetical protein